MPQCCIQMEHILYPVRGKDGFWKQVDKELQDLEKKLEGKRSDQQVQIWSEYVIVNLKYIGHELSLLYSWGAGMITGEITDLAAFKDHVKNNPRSEATEMVKSAPQRRKGLASWGDDEDTSMGDESGVDGEDGDPGDGQGCPMGYPYGSVKIFPCPKLHIGMQIKMLQNLVIY